MTRLICCILALFLAISVPQSLFAQTTPGDGTDDPYGNGGAAYPEYGEHDDHEVTPGLSQHNRYRTIGLGRPEIIVTGPIGEFGDANSALQSLGAELLRFRDLPELGLRIAIYDFHFRTTVPEAQDSLDQAAPNTFVGTHHVYSLSQGRPRLYAPEMIGDVGSGACALRRGLAVGIIDGPVDASHPALAAARIVTENVLSANERAPGLAHGTAVAGLIAGEASDSGLGGFARGAQIYAVSAFTRDGGNPGADIERIATAIDYLIAQNVRLINMSFAGPQNQVMNVVLNRAASRGVVMVAAAGNNGRELAAYPAAHPAVIAVTAVDAAFRRYRSANFGDHIEFAAPGVDVYVADGRGGTYASGTSYAAPIVTALAARLASAGGLSTERLRQELRSSAVDLGADGFDSEFGWGLVRGGC